MADTKLLPLIISTLKDTRKKEVGYEDLVRSIKTTMNKHHLNTGNVKQQFENALHLGNEYGLVYEKNGVIRLQCNLNCNDSFERYDFGRDKQLDGRKSDAMTSNSAKKIIVTTEIKNMGGEHPIPPKKLQNEICNTNGRRRKRSRSTKTKRSRSRSRSKPRSRSRSRSKSRRRKSRRRG